MFNKDFLSMAKPRLHRNAGKGNLARKCIFTRASASLLAIAVVFQTSCAAYIPTHKVPDASTLGNVWVATSTNVPKIEIEGLGGAGEGAARAAGETAEWCLNIGSGCPSSTGPGEIICAPIIIINYACLLVGTPVAALVGAANAPSSNSVQEYKKNFSVQLNAKVIQEALRDKVVAVAFANGRQLSVVPSISTQDVITHDYHALVAKGVDTVLEVSITNIDLKGSGIDKPLTLIMVAHSRLIRTKDNAEVGYTNDVYRGQTLKLSEWSANQDEQLVHGLYDGYDYLGTNIYDHIFLTSK